MSGDPRMTLTLREVAKYLIIPRHHALVIWRFPVLYQEQKPCKL